MFSRSGSSCQRANKRQVTCIEGNDEQPDVSRDQREQELAQSLRLEHDGTPDEAYAHRRLRNRSAQRTFRARLKVRKGDVR